MLELKGGLCPTLGCSQIKAQCLERTVSVCYRGLSKLSRSNGSLEEHPPQRSLFGFPSGACRFHPVLTDSEPHWGLRSRTSRLPWIMSQIATTRT